VSAKVNAHAGLIHTSTVADIGLVTFDKFYSQIIQLGKVITRVGDLPRLITKPSHCIQDTLKIPRFLCFRISIVVPEIALAAMECCIAKVDKNGFRMSNVEIAVGFRRETRPDCATGRGEMLLPEMGMDLGVFARLV